MKRGGSLQRQLGVSLSVGVAVMWLITTLATAFVVRHELDEAFDSNLQEAAQRLLPLAVIEILNRQDDTTALVVSRLDEHDEYLTYLVRDVSGEVLLQSHDVKVATFPPAPSRGFRETATHRIYGEAAVSGTIFIEVAEPLAHRREATIEAVAVLFIPLLVLLPVTLFGVWWLVRRSMRTVINFRDAMEGRGGADLSPLEVAMVPDEIRPIADGVNSLLIRLRRTVQAERNFSANSAHELRTPIAAALALTQRLLAEVPDEATKERASQIEASLKDLAQLSEKLMQLAKAEGGGLLSERPHDLREVLVHVVDGFRGHRNSEAQISLAADENVSLVSHMDPDAFGILMRNLIENAEKHGTAGETVYISVTGQRQISVINSGPVVPLDNLAHLKDRFERRSTKTKGFGLGLAIAIAEMIVTGAGGKLQLLSPATGRKDGFEALVSLG